MSELLALLSELKELHAATLLLVGGVAIGLFQAGRRLIRRDVQAGFSGAAGPFMVVAIELQGRVKEHADQITKLQESLTLTEAKAKAAWGAIEKIREDHPE